MKSVETLIPDNEGNHLVVVLSLYEDNYNFVLSLINPKFVSQSAKRNR